MTRTSTEKSTAKRNRVVEDVRRIKQWGYQTKFYASEIAKNNGLKSGKSASQILKGIEGICRIDHNTYTFVDGVEIKA